MITSRKNVVVIENRRHCSNGTSTFNLQPSFANSDTEYEQNVSLFELLPFLRTCSLAIGFPLAKRTNNLLHYSTSSIRKMRRTGCLLLRLSRTPWELFVASKDIAGEEEAQYVRSRRALCHWFICSCGDTSDNVYSHSFLLRSIYFSARLAGSNTR